MPPRPADRNQGDHRDCQRAAENDGVAVVKRMDSAVVHDVLNAGKRHRDAQVQRQVGIAPQMEAHCVAGVGARWGDVSHLARSPVSDCVGQLTLKNGRGERHPTWCSAAAIRGLRPPPSIGWWPLVQVLDDSERDAKQVWEYLGDFCEHVLAIGHVELVDVCLVPTLLAIAGTGTVTG